MKKIIASITTVALLAVGASMAVASGDGEAVYKKKCKACHNITGKKKMGPNLEGVFGRESVPAMGKLDEEKLTAWLTDPDQADWSQVSKNQLHLLIWYFLNDVVHMTPDELIEADESLVKDLFYHTTILNNKLEFVQVATMHPLRWSIFINAIKPNNDVIFGYIMADHAPVAR